MRKVAFAIMTVLAALALTIAPLAATDDYGDSHGPSESAPSTTEAPTEVCVIADALDAGWTPGGDIPCAHGPQVDPLPTFVHDNSAVCLADGTAAVTFVVRHLTGHSITVGTGPFIQGGSATGGPGSSFYGTATVPNGSRTVSTVAVTVDGVLANSQSVANIPDGACPVVSSSAPQIIDAAATAPPDAVDAAQEQPEAVAMPERLALTGSTADALVGLALGLLLGGGSILAIIKLTD